MGTPDSTATPAPSESQYLAMYTWLLDNLFFVTISMKTSS